MFLSFCLIICFSLLLSQVTETQFSLQYHDSVKQTSDENKEKYLSGDYLLIQYQILWINTTRIVLQPVRRIANVILRIGGLNF